VDGRADPTEDDNWAIRLSSSRGHAGRETAAGRMECRPHGKRQLCHSME